MHESGLHHSSQEVMIKSLLQPIFQQDNDGKVLRYLLNVKSSTNNVQKLIFIQKKDVFDQGVQELFWLTGGRHLGLTLRFWDADKSNDYTLVCGSKSIFFIKIENLGLNLSIQISFI